MARLEKTLRNDADTKKQLAPRGLKNIFCKTFNKPSRWYGVFLAGIIAIIATILGDRFPAVGGPIFAIFLGLIIRNTVGVLQICQPGLSFASRAILQWSIILLGLGLNFKHVLKTGAASFWLTVITIIAAFLTSYLLGRLLKINSNLRNLIAVGTAICGGSAIAALTPIIRSKEHETLLAISTVFMFNIAAVIVFPFFGHLLNMTDLGFGLWAGTAINDTSSVVAAAYSYSKEAGDYATIVKLTRATFIIPICIIYVILEYWNSKNEKTKLNIHKLIPWFIIWFVIASLVRTSGILPMELLILLSHLAKFLMVLALVAIGLSSNIRAMALSGWQPLLLGLATWVVVATSSLFIQAISVVW